MKNQFTIAKPKNMIFKCKRIDRKNIYNPC